MLSIHVRLGLPSGLFPSAFPIDVSLLPHSCYMSCPPHFPRHYNSNCTWRRVQITQLLVMQLSPSLFGPDIFLCTLLSNTLSVCAALTVRDLMLCLLHQIRSSSVPSQKGRLLQTAHLRTVAQQASCNMDPSDANFCSDERMRSATAGGILPPRSDSKLDGSKHSHL
jgi:hypothetical protein